MMYIGYDLEYGDTVPINFGVLDRCVWQNMDASQKIRRRAAKNGLDLPRPHNLALNPKRQTLALNPKP